MKVLMFKDHDEASHYAAQLVINQLKEKPDSVLGLATGSTPIELYDHLIDAVKAGEISFKEVSTFNLDEYLGIEADHPESFATFMQEELFKSVDMNPERIHIPKGMAEDPEAESQAYERELIEKGPINLQILGLGSNAHIGFNEPGEILSNKTHMTRLSEKTREDNARFFHSLEDVPTHAITMGIGSIMRAEKIILLASGQAKADAIQKTVEGPITTQVPASMLQLHPEVLLLVDQAAGSTLEETSYEII